MAKYFSASTVAFYDTDIIDSNHLPEDSVLLTDEEYADLMAQQCAGYVIVAGTDGRPVAMPQVCEPCSCLAHDETIATTEKLGHIKIGSGLTIEEDGTVSAQGNITVGDGLSMDENGVMSSNLLTINNNLPDETGNITPKQTGCIPMTYITNCITEEPQNVNLGLTDGVLTLMERSKVYEPNGFEDDGTTPKFKEIVIDSDTVMSLNTAKKYFVYLKNGEPNTMPNNEVYSFSGETAPTVTNNYALWYDTQNNIIKYTSNNGVSWNGPCTFPLAIINNSLNDGTRAATSIDCVFNGIGYIGSSLFCLPNVKGLAPDYRNADGTLKNKEFITNKVLVYTDTGVTGEYYIQFNENHIGRALKTFWFYNARKNKIEATDGQILGSVFAGSMTLTDGVISNFSTKLPFRAVDWNDIQDVVPTGTVIGFAPNKQPTGYILCNGAAISRTTYARLFDAIGTTYGEGDGSTTFNVPNLINRFVMGSTTAGTAKSAGLPNITGQVYSDTTYERLNGSSASGAFYSNESATLTLISRGGSISTSTGVSFQASRSNSIYGASTTVQPPALTMRKYIKY